MFTMRIKHFYTILLWKLKRQINYELITPLTCTENGYLTEIKREDKIEYPEKIVATYWKNEPAEEWGSDSRKVKVNGRKWVKIK